MAIYFEHQIQTNVASSIHTDIAWHGIHNIIAVSSYTDEKGGFVNLFNNEGARMDGEIPGELSAQVTSMSWHPTKQVLVIAWESGELLSWNQVEAREFRPEVQHKAPVAALVWSSSGSRLISADANGAVICWQLDGHNCLVTVFHHEMKDSLTQVVFRTVYHPDKTLDIGGLARAAVSGDENALDLFSSWHPRHRAHRLSFDMERKENLNFFAGSTSGVIYYINENGSSVDAIRLDAGIQQLLHHEDRDLLVVVTEGLILYQFQIGSDGSLSEISKVKLIGKSLEAFVTWAGKGILVVATGDNSTRMWDIDMGDNYVLASENNSTHDVADMITAVSFCSQKSVLACGTNRGSIILWKYMGDINSAARKDSEKSWKYQAMLSVQGAIKQARWGTAKGLLAVNTVRDVFILTEQTICAHFKDQVSAIQSSPTQLMIDLFASKQRINFRTDLQISGVYVTVEHIAVWNGKKVGIYEISLDTLRLVALGAFSASTLLVCLYEQNVYTVEENKVHVRTFQGTIKQTLTFLEEEGMPSCIEICSSYLVVGTTTGIIKIWDLSRREAKLHASPKSIVETTSNVSGIISAKSNCNGTRISLLVQTQNGSVDPKLYVWDIETNTTQYFNFSSGHSEEDDVSAISGNSNADLSMAERTRYQAAKEICGRQPTNHFWDVEDPRQLVCQAVAIEQDKSKMVQESKVVDKEPMMISMFVTNEMKILVQEATLLNESAYRIIGLAVPYYYVLSRDDLPGKDQKSESSKSKNPACVVQELLKDFVGLEDADKKTRQAMTNFSYYLTTGNMDEAFKAIKTIKSGSVWENMAKMCVKTKRLDVASVCLGNMGNARGAKALREAAKEPELDARVAALAIQLGMLNEAEVLYTSCGRYDLLNKLYQDSGKWHKALEVAEANDRIHLRTTYYNFAKFLEASGDIVGAISSYEKSDTHQFEVPRMLSDEPQALEEYITRNSDKNLKKWWAQYMESTGEMEVALQCYELAQDYLSLVRVYCYCNNLEKAAEIANETGDKAACYHLGRQYENQGDVKEAVHFYTRAHAYSNAIRLCKENELEDQLLNLALMGNAQELVDVARHYENRPDLQHKAVTLYQKAGHYGKAIELAFQLRYFSALQEIANELNEKTDPQLLQRCAQFFMENNQFDRAVDLLAVAKKYTEALDLCVEHNVPVTEQLAEKLTPSKDDADAELRTRILEKVADSCFQQGNYHLATKKYTQAGNRIKAMKALLKSGDTEKIVFFANVSRQKEIYIMAANYLQSLEWRQKPEIMKSIIGFYTKGRAIDLLAGFYEACAQVEIDEFHNYDKAVGALSEACRCWMKLEERSPAQEQRVSQLNAKLEIVKKFVNVRKMYEQDPAEAMKMSQMLLTDSELDMAVHRGDVYGFMIEHYARHENYKAAHSLIEEMRSQMGNVNFAYYVDVKTLELIHSALGLPLPKPNYISTTKDGNHLSATDLNADHGDEIGEEDVPNEIYNGGDT